MSRFRHGLVAAAVVSGVVAASLIAAAPASAGEVARTHPTGTSPGGDPATDLHMTLVKYYDSGKYEFCVDNAHPAGAVRSWSAQIAWSDGYDQPISQPPGHTELCSGFRAAHGSLSVSYAFGSISYFGSL